jgi:hypothetical protein
MIRTIAAERDVSADQPELVGCWISSGWSCGLSVDPSRGWVDQAQSQDDGMGGLVSVLIARRHRRSKISVCGYLVDVYCLGVKSTIGPKVLNDERALSQFIPNYYRAHTDGWQPAPIDLAAHLVFGAVDYARGLGFEPEADFGQVAGHLGEWEPPCAITFGKDGKPFYISGPRDNPLQVVKTLERTVGPSPNFESLVIMDATPGFFH